MDDTHSVIINIPIPRVCARYSTIEVKRSQLQRRLKRIMLKKSQEYSKSFLIKYTAPQKSALRVKTIEKEEFLLPYRLYAKEQEKIKHRYEMEVTIRQKYKMKVCDYRNRLWVHSPPDDVVAMTDTDEGFYKYVNGRAYADHVPIYKTLKAVLTQQLRTKQEVGYRHDKILNIEIYKKHEMQAYEQSIELLATQTKCLDSFVSDDYHKSIALVRQCDQFQQKLIKQLMDLQFLADKQCYIISSLMGLDHMYYLQQRYGRFLYYLSPPSWRAHNRKFARSLEIELNGFDLGGADDETFNVTFDKMKKECFSSLISPALYFTHPDELTKLLEGFEKQQLNYLEYAMHLAPLIRQAKEDCKALKNQMDQDSADVKCTIMTFETLLEYSEDQCAQLESKFFKILNGLFYDSVAAPQVIKLFSNLEFSYEQLFAETPLNVDIVSMAKCLESYYMDFCKRLEALELGYIKDAIKKAVETERVIFMQAKRAKKELFIFSRLEKGLSRAFALPPAKKGKIKEDEPVSVQFKSMSPMISKKDKKQLKSVVCKGTVTRKSLSDAELEYLALFTDWTHDQDPANYLHS